MIPSTDLCVSSPPKSTKVCLPQPTLLSDALSDLKIAPKTFRFFDLPYELRSKILGYVLISDRTIDLDPQNYRTAHQRLSLFLTSHRFHEEAYPVFYGGHTFRILPTHGRFFGNKTKPLLTRLSPQYRAVLVSLELRLGPGWSNPPKSWRVDDRLGLEEMAAVRTVKVFVECDPSHDIFKGFRIGREFFTDFSVELLEGILHRLPALVQVEYDGWPSVMREGPLMRRLIKVSKDGGKRVKELSIQQSFEKRHKLISLKVKNVG